MINFFEQNPMLFVVLVFVLFCLIIYILLKLDGKKKKKKSAIKKESKEKKSEERVETTEKSDIGAEEKALDEVTESSTDVEDEKKDKSLIKKKKTVKKAKNKPEITRVYEKTEKKVDKTPTEEYAPSISEDELLSKMQFVKSSNTVSKLTKFSSLEQKEQEMLEGALVEYEEYKPQEIKKEVQHFDKTRRLSKCVECGSFDDMFCSHISEHYLNIDSSRHLKIGDDFEEKLYGRAAETLANSSAKVDNDVPRETVSAEGLTRKDSMKSWIENKKREELAKFSIVAGNQPDHYIVDCEHEDIDLSAKNLLVVDSIINRKRLSNSKR